jgi:hypothetical protein
MSELVKDLKRSAKEITTALQPLIASELVEIDQQSIYFNTKLIQTSLFNETLDAHVSRAISPDARRVVALLRAKPHLTDSEIQHLTLMLDNKTVRKAIGSADERRFGALHRVSEAGRVCAVALDLRLVALARGAAARKAARSHSHITGALGTPIRRPSTSGLISRAC